MKRLTYDGDYCEDIARCGTGNSLCGGKCRGRQLWERLKAYEDTGLEPEEIGKTVGSKQQIQALPFGGALCREEL